MKFILFLLIILHSSDIFAQTIYSYSKENNGVKLHDTIVTNIRKKCVHSYLSYKQYYNENVFPYKKLTKRFMDYKELIPDTINNLEAVLNESSSTGFWIWPYLSAYLRKRDDSKIFKNYSAFYVYDSVYQFHGVVAVNDTDHTNIKLLGGQFANIELMFDELSSKGIDKFDHFIGKFYPYSKRYNAGRRKIELSDITTSLELYSKILSRTFDPSFFGFEIYKYRPSYLSGAILHNSWVNYHRGKINYNYYKNGEYEIVVTADIFVLYTSKYTSNVKTRNFSDTGFGRDYVSTDYPYASFEGYIPAEIKFRINPSEETIKVKITKVKDINPIPEYFLQRKK